MMRLTSFFAQLGFELKTRLARPSGWIYFALYFCLSFLMALLYGGAFPGFVYSFGLSSRLPLNSPIVIHQIVGYVGYLGFLVIAPLFAEAIHRDFQHRFSQIVFATPITKRSYFFIRFLGAFLCGLVVFSSIGLAIWVATWTPWIDGALTMENHFWHYLAPYLTTLLPNLFVFGSLFMAVIALKKKMGPVYTVSIVLFTGFMISGRISDGVENMLVAALSDPFGLVGAHQVTRYWSLIEQKSQGVPLVGNFLANRLFWSGAGVFLLAVGYGLFNPFRLPKAKKQVAEEVSSPAHRLPDVPLCPSSWKVFVQLALSEFKQAFSSLSFLMILLCAVLYVFAVSGYIGKWFGTETLPVTYHVLEAIKGSFALFVLIITTFYGGELVWKDRGDRMHELIDATPVSHLYLYLSKLSCLFFIQLLLLGLVCVASVLVQLSRGYTHFEWTVYLQFLVIYTLPAWLLNCVFVLWAQTIVPHKHVGHCLVILYYTLRFLLPSLGLEEGVYLIGALPVPFYSDMNGFGPLLAPFSIYALYWGVFHFCLAVVTVLLWQRGVIVRWKDRFAELRARMRGIHRALLGTGVCVWLVLGGFIVYNTHLLNPHKTKKQQQQEQVDYELTYQKYQHVSHPILTAVSIEVDLFPQRQAMEAKGVFRYENQSEKPIDTLLIHLPHESHFTHLHWSQAAHILEENRRLGVQVVQLDEPLAPGAALQLTFALQVEPQGFKNLGAFSHSLVANGTFFDNDHYFPVVGYDPRREIIDAKTRRKEHLPEKELLASWENQEAARKNFITGEGNWIDFEAIVSTSADQIAIAPGYLEKEWATHGRRYFHYKMDRPMLPFYAILSGRYERAKDTWQGVEIEILHHPTHTLNIERMMEAVKCSLDYYTTHFSPYQFRQIRIVEFPRYESFAQSFPTTVPYSEALGFIAKVNPDDPSDIHYPFYVTAHEVAHQWWGHQVVGGMVEGSSMLSESLAQYSALMVLEKEMGPEQMQKFLKYELDQYLNGRSLEEKKELPLSRNQNQGYICYQKGTLAFYRLKDLLGEERVNAVLARYIQDVAFQAPPFTRSVDLVDRFKQGASAWEKERIEELFDQMVLQDNRTASVTYCKTDAGKYLVTIHSIHQKWRCDEEGNESPLPLDDLIDVGIYDASGKLIYLEKHKVDQEQTTFQIEVDQEPAKAGIDPLNKLIDRLSAGHLLKAAAQSQDQ